MPEKKTSYKYPISSSNITTHSLITCYIQLMIKIFTRVIMIITLLGGSGPIFGKTLIVRHKAPVSAQDLRTQYFLSLLSLTLDKTIPTHGPYQLQVHQQSMQQGRTIVELQKQALDIIWSVTSIEREKMLAPIRIPLLKGLLSHRIFIINKRDQARFAAIKNIDQLRLLSAGQGHDWPDLKILRHNNLTSYSGSTYLGLFGMLSLRRFDYFPRGINEAWQEVATIAPDNLMVEQTLLLQYPSPIYFFFNSSNKALKERVEQGLLLAIEDGSFDLHLYNHPSIKQALQLSKMSQRTLITLKNPLLSVQSKSILARKSLWYVVGEEKKYQAITQP